MAQFGQRAWLRTRRLRVQNKLLKEFNQNKSYENPARSVINYCQHYDVVEVDVVVVDVEVVITVVNGIGMG